MIHKLILCAVMFSTTLPIANGQGFRHADLKVKFVTPDSNAVFASPADIPFTFRVYNQGPDTIWPTDSLTFKPSHTLVNYSKTETVAWGKMVAKGDSMDFSSSVYVNYSKDLNNFQLFFGEIPLAFGFTKDKGTLYSETNETQADNNAKVSFKLLGSSNVTENELVHLEVFPNPVTNGAITISGISEIGKVILYNNTMQLISQTEPDASSNSATIPINNVPQGIYFVQVTTTEGSFVKRILVSPE